MSGLGSRFVNAGYLTPKPLIVIDGKTIIEQHKVIYAILNKYIETGEIHALTLKTKPKK